MSEQITYYRESNFSLYQVTGNFTLLLQMGAATFSYAVIHHNLLISWAKDCDYSELDDPSEAYDLLTYDYKNVITGLSATAFTIIPAALYDAGRIADLARYLDVKPGEKVFSQPLDDSNYVIYKLDEKTAAQAELFGLEKTVFTAKGWISAVAKSSPANDNLYLNVDKKQVEILYFADGKLRFYNTFSFSNPDELAYYAAYVAQELELQPDSLNLILSGDISMDDENAARLAQFFNGIELNYLRLLKLPPHIPSHQIMALAALSLCVSSEVY